MSLLVIYLERKIVILMIKSKAYKKCGKCMIQQSNRKGQSKFSYDNALS